MGFKWIGKSADGNSVTLQRLNTSLFQFSTCHDTDLVRKGAVIDVETTGLNRGKDKVIEVGVRQFKFNRSTGALLGLESSYAAFQDPETPLSDETKMITGITDEMVKGQKIEWNTVDKIISESQIVIAHNAAFDRPFIDQFSISSREKIWGCSLKQIDWFKKGFTSQKLDSLGIYHGFFNDGHRALNDAESLLYLLSQTDHHSNSPYLLELLTQAKKPLIHLVASGAPFESKDHLKNRHYRWDVPGKCWSKMIDKELLPTELEWLESTVYQGTFRGNYSEIQPVDMFKS